jgi:hypothetical protein
MLGQALLTGVLLGVSILGIVPNVDPYPYPEYWKNDGAGHTFVLYRKHNVRAMSQGSTGSCVGCATAKALELMHGRQYSPEWLYGGSRKHFQAHYNPFAGSFVGWAAQMVKDVGALPSKDYSVMGDDLRVYSPSRARRWQRGPPDTYQTLASEYRSGFVKIETWEQLRDSIANEVPVIVGSQVGFGSKSGARRSRSGMLRSRWWSRWNHAMVFCGVSDGVSKRALLLNSWGIRWISGPKWLGDEPDGSFWISKRDAEKMLSYGDAYAILPIPGEPF